LPISLRSKRCRRACPQLLQRCRRANCATLRN